MNIQIKTTSVKFMLLLVLLLSFASSVLAAPPICSPTTPPNKLNFTSPSTNTDGSALTDLAGFKLYYSNTSGTESTGTIKDVLMDGSAGPGTQGNILLSSLGLTDGLTYYFKLSAYDTAKLESALSNETSCTYDATTPAAPGINGVQ